MKPTMHPGRLLLDTMLASDWRASELAARMGCDIEWVRDLLTEVEDVTPEIAEQMSWATGISTNLFLNLQKSYNAAHNPEISPEAVNA